MDKILTEIEKAILSEVNDAREYLIMNINIAEHNGTPISRLYYYINQGCPQHKQDAIKTILFNKAEELKLPIITPHLPE